MVRGETNRAAVGVAEMRAVCWVSRFSMTLFVEEPFPQEGIL